MKRLLPGGFLVAVEGIDGSGKSTVSAMLAQFFGERGIACLFSREPTWVGPGRRLRESAQSGRLTLDEEVALFLEDRIAHSQRAVRPALAEGAIVVLDRYYWSTAAYQGARGAAPAEIIAQNERAVPRPDLVLFVDVPPEVGLQRVSGRGDAPNHFEKLGTLTRVAEIFRSLHANAAAPSVRIDGEQMPAVVLATARDRLCDALLAAMAARGREADVAEARSLLAS